MKPRPATPLLAATTAVLVVVFLGACKTVRTKDNWRSEAVGDTEWERNLGRTVKRSAAEISDPDLNYTSSAFDTKKGADKKTKSSPFGKKIVKEESFRTKEFAGADEYKNGDYQFLKRQDYKAKAARDQDQRYGQAKTESSDAKKRFFWQRKKARTKDFGESDKLMRTGDYNDTKRNSADRQPNIVKDPAAEDRASLSIDDVRQILHGPQ